MADATRRVSVRLSLDDAARVKQELREVGETGQRSLARIQGGAERASRALDLLDIAVRGVQIAGLAAGLRAVVVAGDALTQSMGRLNTALGSPRLTPAAIAAAASPVAAPVVLVELDFASGFFRAWTGIGPLHWAGKVFEGLGAIGAVSEIEETVELRAVRLTLSLSPVPQEVVDIALAERSFRLRPARLWGVLLDAEGAFVADPFPLWAGLMDVMEVTDGTEARISLTCESRLVDLERAEVRRYTDADQQAEYQGDRFFEYLPALQEAEIRLPAQ
jgi:hypothetical protein